MDSEGLLAEPLDSHLLRLSGTDEENDGSGVSFEPFPSGTAEDVAMEERAEENEAVENEKDVAGSGDEDADEEEEEDDSQVYCLCRQPDDGTFMISCDKCEEWFHGRCVGVTASQGKSLSNYECPPCSGAPTPKLTPKRPNDEWVPEGDSEKRPRIDRTARSEKPLPPSVQRKLNRQKLEARLSVKRNSDTSVTISAKPKEDMVRSLARKGLEATFKLIFDDVKERPLVYKVDPKVDLNEPKAMAEKIEQELFVNLAVAKVEGQRPSCGDAYKNKYRSLQFNLKDKKNISLRERILKGEVTPSNLVRFSSQELGNEDLQAALESIQESSLKNVFKPVASSTTMSVAAPLSDQSLSLSSLSSSKAEGGDVAKGGVKQPLAAEGVLPTKKVVTHVPPPPKAPIKIFPKKAEFKSLDEILSRMEKASAPRAHDSLDPLPTRSPVTAIRPPIDSHSDRKEKIEIVSKRQSAETLWEGKLGMHQVGRFSGYAFQVFGPWMGNKNIWADLLSSSLMIEGRIPTSAAGAYVSESAASKDIVVFALSPGRPPVESQQSIVEQSDAVAYQTLFDYFATRARYGVVPHPDRGSRLRDSYIMPLGRNEELPTCLRDLASDNGQFYLDPVPRPSDLLLCVLILIRGSSIKKGAPRKSNGSHSVSKPSGSSRDQRHSERPMETSQPRGPMYSPPVASFSLPVQNAPAIAASGLLANLMSGTAPMSQYPQQNQQQYQQQHHQMPFAPQPQQFQQSQIQQPPAIQLPPNLDISGLLAQLQGVLGNQPPQRPPH